MRDQAPLARCLKLGPLQVRANGSSKLSNTHPVCFALRRSPLTHCCSFLTDSFSPPREFFIFQDVTTVIRLTFQRTFQRTYANDSLKYNKFDIICGALNPLYIKKISYNYSIKNKSRKFDRFVVSKYMKSIGLPYLSLSLSLSLSSPNAIVLVSPIFIVVPNNGLLPSFTHVSS